MKITRQPPEGAKPAVVPAPPRAPSTIDVTPTWRGILPLLLAAHESGTFNGRKEAEAELRRMADLADIYVKLAAHDGAAVQALLAAATAADGDKE